MATAEMLRTHPRTPDIDVDVVARAVDAAAGCATTCTVCADACLAEESFDELRACIRANLDCADVCEATARLVSRLSGGGSEAVRGQVEACLAACRACADERERHAEMHAHCRACAEACRACASACEELLEALA